jgi:hypothetical protein
LGETRFHDDEDVEKVLNRVLWKIIGNPIAYVEALKDFIDFVESWSHFSNTPLVNDLILLLHQWWNLIGVGGCTFTPITHCILVCVLCHCVNEIEVHNIHLSITKCEIG